MATKEELTEYIQAKQRETRILAKNTKKNIKHYRIEYYNIKKHADNFIGNETPYYQRAIFMPGLRGVGKTTILYQLCNHLTDEKNIPENDILFLDVHDLKTSYDEDIKEIFELYLENNQQCTPVTLNKKIFLFVDEAQLDKNWAKYAKLLYDKSTNIFTIFTGSSALDLELNSDATRRLFRKQIYPCNFKEYLLLKHDTDLNKNNFKDLILKGDEKSIKKAIECEKTIKNEMIRLENDPQIELKQFIHSKGFPFALNLDETETHLITNDIIERIVNYDLKEFGSFNTASENIMQLIAYLATKKPGKTSNNAIAQSLNLNVRTVTNILSVLEKSQLIFSVSAYGSAGKMLKKPSQHFFLTPSLKAAQNYRVGRYDLNHEKCYSVLVENLVASSLKRLSDETQESLGLFYDANKKGVDFIIKHLDKIIPVEVGIGKKTKSQLTIAKNRYSADYGILISNRTKSIKYENGILYIPLLTFALM